MVFILSFIGSFSLPSFWANKSKPMDIKFGRPASLKITKNITLLCYEYKKTLHVATPSLNFYVFEIKKNNVFGNP